MTKKLFARVAETISLIPNIGTRMAEAAMWCGIFKKTNKRFDESKFTDACMGKVITPKSFEKLKEWSEQTLCEAGALVSKPFHARAFQLLESLAKKYPIKELLMGNGTFVFRGLTTKEKMTDGEEQDFDWGDCLDFARHLWDKNSYPARWTEQDQKEIEELYEILCLLTDEPYYQLCEWENKKLVDKD